ncbi:androgen-dependent TFPI-regulating protein [Lissotriton helveticus]
MATTTLTAYHFVAFLWYFLITCLVSALKADHQPSGVFLYGGQWKYLTILNVLLQTVFYGISLLADLLEPISKLRVVKFITSCKDLLFSVLAFPVAMFVFTSFWGLYSYNRELVYPKGIDEFIPLWLNHAMHTAIFPLTLLETFATPHHYPPKKSGLGLLGFFSFGYLCWVIWIYIAVGEWVYPLLGLLSPLGFLAFISTSLVLVAFIYIIGDILNSLKWGATESQKKPKLK